MARGMNPGQFDHPKDLKIDFSPVINVEELTKEVKSDSQKKAQQKTEKLTLKIESFRLTSTKKLMREGFNFEKARKESFKRSLMHKSDLYKLEMSILKKKAQFTSRYGQVINDFKKKSYIMMAGAGSFLSGIAGSALSGLKNLLAGSVKKNIEKHFSVKKIGASFKKEDISAFHSILKQQNQDGRYSDELVRLQAIKEVSALQADLVQAGQTTTDDTSKAKDILRKAATLVNLGQFEDINAAINSIRELIKGEASNMFEVMRTIDAKKYDELEMDLYRQKVQTGDKMAFNEMLRTIISDVTNRTPSYGGAENMLKVQKNIEHMKEKIQEKMMLGMEKLAGLFLSLAEAIQSVISKLIYLYEKFKNFKMPSFFNFIPGFGKSNPEPTPTNPSKSSPPSHSNSKTTLNSEE